MNIEIEIMMAYVKYAVLRLTLNNIPLTFYSLENELKVLVNSYDSDRIVELVDEITENSIYC